MTLDPVAVGLDPSLTCSGIATIDTATGDVQTRRVKTEATGKALADVRRRIRRVVGGTLDQLPARIGVTVIEAPNHRSQFGAQNERMAIYWFLVDQLLARGPVVSVAPSTRAKLATGSGRGTKTDVITAMRAAFPTAHVPDDNVADALALAAAGAHWLGDTQAFYTAAHLTAHSKLPWPHTTITTH